MKVRLTSKTTIPLWLVAAFLGGPGISSQAQTYPGTTVTIRAADPYASELPATNGVVDPGLFVVSRVGPTNINLPVYLRIGGTASNGLDYVAISNRVVIPAGSTSLGIPVTPLDDALPEGTETVVVRVEPPICPAIYPPPPECYQVGTPAEAVVYIADDDQPSSNIPPTVKIVSPAGGSIFSAPAQIMICADARDADGYVNTVEFFAGPNSLGIKTNCLPCASVQNPFCLTWSNVPPGDYVLTAKATDNSGTSTISDPIPVKVVLHTNSPPYVQLNSPTDGASFVAPANVSLRAYAQDPEDGENITVEFFQGTNSLGLGVFVPTTCPSPYCPFFALTWSNVPPGAFVLTAKATDTTGAASVSAPVHIRVTEPQPSNAPPKVTIVSPTNGTVFTAPVNIQIDAAASDPDDNVVRVDFFAGDHFIGGITGTNLGVYSIVWSNALPGLYSLHATARDDHGALGFSEPVRIAVTGTNLPPTNLPPIVTIYAPDPLAAEGTNSWRWCTNTTLGATAAMQNYGGTNTATFLFRRAGSTNDALIVTYEIRGSASNGVDYAAIPNSVTIPAGERSARVVIVPIDDSIPECPETVVLRLTPDTNTPPPYVVGWPSRAAAIIADNDAPAPGTTVLCDGTFNLCLAATNGFNYRLECSPDMIHWVPVCTNTVTQLGVVYAEPDTQEFPTRFYRVVPQTSSTSP